MRTTISTPTLIFASYLSDIADTQPMLAVPKPPTKRAKKALRVAALEVFTSDVPSSDYNSLIAFLFKKPAFIDDEEEEVKPRRPTGEKNATAGRKPKITASDPIFDQIWKTASKELKRYIFFVNPFPNSGDYDLLPQRVYNKATNLIRQSGYRYTKGVESQARQVYSAEWSSGVSHQSTPQTDRDLHLHSYPTK